MNAYQWRNLHNFVEFFFFYNSKNKVTYYKRTNKRMFNAIIVSQYQLNNINMTVVWYYVYIFRFYSNLLFNLELVFLSLFSTKIELQKAMGLYDLGRHSSMWTLTSS